MGSRTTGSVVDGKPARVAPQVDGIEAVSTAALDVLEGCHVPTRAGSTSYPGAFAEILRHFARDLARRGFAFGPGGAVVETWRARARGRWLDASGIVRPEDALPVEESRSLVRVEGDQTLEVFENGGEWQAVVDGVDLVAFPSRAQAMRYVLDRVGAKDRAPRRK